MKTRTNDETRNYVFETFGQPSNGSMKNQNGLDEIDIAAEKEGNSFSRLNRMRPKRRLVMCSIK